MNWLWLAIGLYILSIWGVVVFVFARGRKHTDAFNTISQWRTNIGQLFQNMTKFFSLAMLWVVGFQLLCGIALVVWTIIILVKAI
jgi:hypothetical protein